MPNSPFITVYINQAEMARFERLTRFAHGALGLSRSGMVRDALGLWGDHYTTQMKLWERRSKRRAAKAKQAKAKQAKAKQAKLKPKRRRS